MNIQYCSCINLAVLQVCPGHAHGLSLDEGRSGRDRRECLGAPCLFPEHHLQSNILSFLLTLLGQNFCALCNVGCILKNHNYIFGMGPHKF